MARIRTVKPEFWEDAIIGTLSREARLLFIASWNLADDSGRLRWSPAYLKAGAFIYDEDIDQERVSVFMIELTDCGLIVPYESGRGKQHFAQIVNFLKHQKISHPTPSRFPEPPSVPRGTLSNDSGVIPENIQNRSENNPQEGEREVEVEVDVDMEKDSPPADSDLVVEQIFRTYPQNNVREHGTVLRLPPVDTNAIIDAITRHGPEVVLRGTRCYAKAVSEWPPGEQQKIFGCAKFFNQEMYLFGPLKWSRINGKQASKGAERKSSNRSAIAEEFERRYSGTNAGSGSDDNGLQGNNQAGSSTVVGTPRALPGK